MSDAVICYPRSFFERPEDRRLLMELEALGTPGPEAMILLYRLWLDFATGGSDKRSTACGIADLQDSIAIRMMESYCGWRGERGQLVQACLVSGFLTFEPDGENAGFLRCTGFFPINSSWCRTGNVIQKKGGLARASQRQETAANRNANEIEKRWDEKYMSFGGLDVTRRGAAIRFCLRVSSSLNLGVPGDDILLGEPLRLASEILSGSAEQRIKEVLIWLLANRKSSGMPASLREALQNWKILEQRAIFEMAD